MCVILQSKRRNVALCGRSPADLLWCLFGGRKDESGRKRKKEGLSPRWVVAGVGQWREQKRDLNAALQKIRKKKKKKNSSPFAILCELCLIHRWVFLPLLPSTLNCCLLNSLFFLLIPPCVLLVSPLSLSISFDSFYCHPLEISFPIGSLLSFKLSLLRLPSPFILHPSAARSSAMRHSHVFFFNTLFLLWGGTHSSRTQWLKLPIKSMFNSDDCRPLTEKVEAFHL